MEAFKNSKISNRTRRCSYCRSTDHTAVDCKQAELDYHEWRAYRVPASSPMIFTWMGYDYTKWKQETERIALMREKRDEKLKNPGTRAPRTCGFCKGEDHTRRNCPDLESFLERAYKANQNWRRAFYEKIVKGMGICEGAVVKVSWRDSWNLPDKEGIALVQSINWDEISFLTAPTTRYIDCQYRTPLCIKVLMNGQSREMIFDGNVPDVHGKQEIIQSNGGTYGYKVQYVDTVHRAEKELDESWVTEGMKDEFGWLSKKRTQERLYDLNIYTAIRNWQ